MIRNIQPMPDANLAFLGKLIMKSYQCCKITHLGIESSRMWTLNLTR